MIELRWLERAVKPEHEGATGYYERVLQYRQLDPQHGSYFWTEWADVPTVSESSS